MTLIVGILCSDGIVLAADGAATLGSLGRHTIRQPVKKLEIVGKSAVLGVSGPIGLAQRFRGELEDALRPGRPDSLPKREHEAIPALRQRFWKHACVEFEAAKVAAPVLGQAAVGSVISAALVALVVSEKACLIQFDHQCAPELATRDIPFVSIGSGQQTADPFLAFLRRIYWPDRLPNVGEGLFAVCWTVKHAIDTMPGGVADPMQAVILKKTNDEWAAQELTAQELEEHCQFAGAAEEYLKAFKGELQPDEHPAPDIPKPTADAPPQGKARG